jgi:hypothetical protein
MAQLDWDSLFGFSDCSSGMSLKYLYIVRSPFDTLRANGAGVENIDNFPFMLRLSKHENHFFRTLPERACPRR